MITRGDEFEYLRQGMAGRPTRTLIEFIAQTICKDTAPKLNKWWLSLKMVFYVILRRCHLYISVILSYWPSLRNLFDELMLGPLNVKIYSFINEV